MSSDVIARYQSRLRTAVAPAQRLTLLIEMIDLLENAARPQEQIALLDEAEQLALQLDDERARLFINMFRARYLISSGHYAEAITLGRYVHEQAQRLDDIVLQWRALNVIAHTYGMQGSYREALEILTQCHAHQDRPELRPYLGIIYGNIAANYIYLSQWQAALTELKKALVYLYESSLPSIDRHIVNALENLSFVYFQLDDGAQALAAVEQVAAYCQRTNRPLPNSTYMLRAKALLLLGDYVQAEAEMQAARVHENGMQGDFWLGYVEQTLGDIYAAQHFTDAAETAYHAALTAFSRVSPQRELAETHARLYRFYKATGRFAEALHHHEAFHTITQAVFAQQADHRYQTIQTLHNLETTRLETEAERQRSAALQRELAERESLIEDLDGYARSVAHDLKNPIGTIYTAAHFLNEMGRELPEDVFHRTTHTLVSAAERGVAIVDALLQLARVRKEEFAPVPVALDKIIRQSIQRLDTLITTSGAMLSLPSSLPVVLGEAVWLEQVFVNLISNGIKYGGQPPRVTITAVQEGERVHCVVHDNGDGLTPAEQKRLFKTFSRLERHQQSTSGHGIGLTIVQSVITKLGGEVWVDSTGQPGMGAAFHFTLKAPAPVVTAAASWEMW